MKDGVKLDAKKMKDAIERVQVLEAYLDEVRCVLPLDFDSIYNRNHPVERPLHWTSVIVWSRVKGGCGERPDQPQGVT